MLVYLMYRVYIKRTLYTGSVSDTPHMGIKELRSDLGHRVDAAHFLGEHTVIEKNGEPRAVIISYAQWQETQGAASSAR